RAGLRLRRLLEYEPRESRGDRPASRAPLAQAYPGSPQRPRPPGLPDPRDVSRRYGARAASHLPDQRLLHPRPGDPLRADRGRDGARLRGRPDQHLRADAGSLAEPALVRQGERADPQPALAAALTPMGCPAPALPRSA